MTDLQPSAEVTPTDIERFLTTVGAQATEDPAAVSMAIVASILNAKTAEEVLNRPGTTEAGDVLNQRLAIFGIKWNRSDLADGPGFYGLIEAANDDGERLLITCGSRNVMAQIFRLVELNALPCYAAIVQSERATAAGFFPMALEGRQAP